ncbi:MAG TPA: Gfo/Idh/MocA family oxidoreductase [Solirubrobacteraceae bacterium]|nr:Gfo/Idh/MocA family oxidoreductase [Solirubrobacteraceae bacterium]
MTLRVGIIGAGWIAQRHVPAIDGADGASLVAVCDADVSRARAIADPRGIPAYREWEEMLDREALDALWVCVPPLFHSGPTVAALELGTHVYLEKPLARSVPEGEKIAAAARRSSAVCMVGYQWHASELLDVVRAALGERRVGMLIGRNYGPAAARAWVIDRRQGGGQILERGSHHIDLQRAIAGEIVAVEAREGSVELASHERTGDSIEDVLALVFHFAGGGLGTVNLAWTAEGQPELYALDVIGQDSSIWLELGPVKFRALGRAGAEEINVSYGDPFHRSVGRFFDAVRTGDGARIFCTPEDALETLRVAVACEEALAAGSRIEVSAQAQA